MNPGGLGIVLMAKLPSPGFAKTRLAASIGTVRAAEIAGALLACMIESCGLLACEGRVLAAEPGEPARWTGLLPHGWRIESQGGGDLGARLKRMAVRELNSFDRIVVAGSDHAGLPAGIFQRFAAEKFALWPTQDGGYAALTLSRHPRVARLFEDIPWSTREAAAKTLARAKEIGIDMSVYPETRDVDTAADLEWLSSHLAVHSDPGPSLANLARLLQNPGEATEA